MKNYGKCLVCGSDATWDGIVRPMKTGNRMVAEPFRYRAGPHLMDVVQSYLDDTSIRGCDEHGHESIRTGERFHQSSN